MQEAYSLHSQNPSEPKVKSIKMEFAGVTLGTGFSSISCLILSLDSTESITESYWAMSYCTHAATHISDHY